MMKTRSFVLSALPAAMLMSLICSGSIQYGHADAPIAATAEDVRPLETGEPAPRFTVQTVDGENFEFDPRRLERPAIIITFRGGWCPYCNLHLSELREVVPQIGDMDVDLLFLSGDRSELLYDSLSREAQDDIDGLDYTILSDANANAAIAFGIAFRAPERYLTMLPEKGVDIEESSMSRHGVLPVPAVFAVDRSGKIAYSFVNANYKVRLPADELLAVAADIVKP
ncbi:MAG: peroxiredoxin-like family protein [Pseudomonadota bacterium]